MTRRHFLKNSSLLGFATLLSQFPVWGKSVFAWENPIHNIPENKGINPAWIKSLYLKGDKIAYRKSKDELKYIGMPIGGLHTGTVYIGGDGKLWLWQVFNDSYDGMNEGVENKVIQWHNGKEMVKVRPRDGAAYVEPPIAKDLQKFTQGFQIQVLDGKKIQLKDLDAALWDEVIFEPTYPSCKITYTSQDFPVDVTLTAFTPYIPLDAENSSLPLSCFHLDVVNKTNKSLDIQVIGYLENGVHHGRTDFGQVKKVAQLHETKDGGKLIQFSCKDVPEELQLAGDHGTMGITCEDGDAKYHVDYKLMDLFNRKTNNENISAVDFQESQIGAIQISKKLAPKKSTAARFAIAWHFNHPHPKLKAKIKDAKDGYWYGTKFKDAAEVLAYYLENKTKLTTETLDWVDTWNDSSLPYWFLDRTFLNIGTLATANTMRFASGRFWGWEGIGACAGTCTHVWQYGQSMGRIFPELERNLRETTDLGVGFKPDTGAIIFRAEYESRPAIDGQAGVILRFYRDHQMSKDDAFLKRNWSNLKKAIQFVLDQDKNGDGMTDTPMENTLDAVWEGEIAWIVGLCLAAVQAGAKMAEEVGDAEFQQTCENYVLKGSKHMDEELFNGEYYIHRPNKDFGRKKLGSYNTCHIDQVYGQAWTHQLSLPRINDKKKTLTALQALWKYNFTTDVGPYIKTHLNGRPYALAGDGGMVMNTNPKNEDKPYGENVTWQLGYFHECMSGFEHQVAAHMIAEGMLDEGLILTRKIHDRYHGSKRNPFNEIECSDHYARAMASYGSFINACGFTYHGPQKSIGFDPKINPEEFRAAFTAAEGWGTFSQRLNLKEGPMADIFMRYGTLTLRKLSLGDGFASHQNKSLTVSLNGQPLETSKQGNSDNKKTMEFAEEIILRKGDRLIISYS